MSSRSLIICSTTAGGLRSALPTAGHRLGDLDSQAASPASAARPHIDEHFKFNDKGAPNYFRIPGIWRGDKTKTGSDVEGYLILGSLIRRSAALHLRKYHPILDKHASGYLFPGQGLWADESAEIRQQHHTVGRGTSRQRTIRFTLSVILSQPLFLTPGPDNASLAATHARPLERQDYKTSIWCTQDARCARVLHCNAGRSPQISQEKEHDEKLPYPTRRSPPSASIFRQALAIS